MRLLTVIGARPQLVKAATMSRAIARSNTSRQRPRIEETLVHTGQHYDTNMSQVFLEELEIPPPAINLGIGSGSHGEQTGSMLARLEGVMLERRPDRVVVYGDTNSTLAGALAAAKLDIPVAHIEAGLRSRSRRQPEEINRRLTDTLADLLFCPTSTSVGNLAAEGITDGVYQVGDVMYDALRTFAPLATGDLAGQLALEPGGYYLATVHRAENTDDPAHLAGILEGLAAAEKPVVMPLHPRTRQALDSGSFETPANLRLIEPVSYLAMLALERDARIILTDSGGVQKEAYWLGVPCVTLRDETEWVELVATGCNLLAGARPAAILESIEVFEAADARLPEDRPTDLFGNGRAAWRILELMASV